MGGLKIHYYGDPILRKKAKEVGESEREKLGELIKEMDQLMHEKQGVGLAAPQIGISLRLFIARSEIEDKEHPDGYRLGPLQVFINPKLLEPSLKKEVMNEGCLSIPKLRGKVERPFAITVEYEDLEGNKKKERFEGLMARIVMHENDHLNGILYIDRMDKRERAYLEPLLKKIKDGQK